MSRVRLRWWHVTGILRYVYDCPIVRARENKDDGFIHVSVKRLVRIRVLQGERFLGRMQ